MNESAVCHLEEPARPCGVSRWAILLLVVLGSTLGTLSGAFALSEGILTGGTLTEGTEETLAEDRVTGADRYLCKSLPEAIDLLRSSGVQVAYSDGLVSERMIVRRRPSPGAPADLLREMVHDYGLEVRELGNGALSIVPDDTGSLRRLRRITSPLLSREESYDALPEWRGRQDFEPEGTTDPRVSARASVVELDFREGATDSRALDLGENVDYIVWALPERLERPERAAFELKQRIVQTASGAPGVQMGLDGPASVINALMDAELAPYIDGYLFDETPEVPSLDRTGRPWWRTTVGSSTLLERLLEGSARGAALVLLEDAEPSASERGLLRAIRATGAGLLEHQPKVQSADPLFTRVFLDPRSGNFQVAIYSQGSGERLSLELEPELDARVIYPEGAKVASESFGRFIELQLEGSVRHWLIELEKSQDFPGYADALVEDEVIVDPYEVVVRNQIFQRAEADKVLSLDVMEYASITPMWREGQRSLWEHRIFQRRGRLDEYLHLKVYRDGVELPRDKMYKSILGRPVERIELAPLTLENRKTYRYRYLGADEIDGHPTWKIAFEPVVPGRLVSGVVWIDQVTGAHRQIRAEHHNIGVGILSGEYVTRYGWVPGPTGCHWDWDHRYGTETYDYLDFEGVAQIDYTRRGFRYNRPDIDEEIEAAHESDVLIHVATPPEGHRWLLRGESVKPRRGDIAYRNGVLREEDLPQPEAAPVDAEEPQSDELELREERPDAEVAVSLGDRTARGEGDVLNEMLAGPWAFPSRSRVNVGYFGGSAGVESSTEVGFNYLDLDFLRRGRRGKDPLYLWVGGFGSDGLVSLTDPHLLGSDWSLTTSIDLQLDPEEDFLFRQSTPTPGDEGSVANLSLDSERRGVRLSFGTPLTGALSMRLKLGLHALEFRRRNGTAPSFVVPQDTGEITLRGELSYNLRSISFDFGIETGQRDQWQAWGLDGRQEPLDEWSRWDARLTYTRPWGRSQTLSASLGHFGGSDLDRFSRRRLFQVDARVPGYSSSIGFDEGTHVSLSYNFRVWKLPLRLRTDWADLTYDQHVLEPELVDQTFLGTQLNLDLNGPWETDLLFGVGRGLHAEPRRDNVTSYWMIVSRRFGGGS